MITIIKSLKIQIKIQNNLLTKKIIIDNRNSKLINKLLIKTNNQKIRKFKKIYLLIINLKKMKNNYNNNKCIKQKKIAI